MSTERQANVPAIMLENNTTGGYLGLLYDTERDLQDYTSHIFIFMSISRHHGSIVLVASRLQVIESTQQDMYSQRRLS